MYGLLLVSRWAYPLDLTNPIESQRYLKGHRLTLSVNRSQYFAVPEPIILNDDVNWNRAATTAPNTSSPDTDLSSYPSIIDWVDGSNKINTAGYANFAITYDYIAPYEGFDRKYLVYQNVSIVKKPTRQKIVVKAELSRWIMMSGREAVNMRSTNAPVYGQHLFAQDRSASFTYEQSLGFLMNRPPVGVASYKLEECSSNYTGKKTFYVQADLSVKDSHCYDGNGNVNWPTRERTLGWIYKDAQPGTHAIYSCHNPTKKFHYLSKRSDCDRIGSLMWLLGYALD